MILTNYNVEGVHGWCARCSDLLFRVGYGCVVRWADGWMRCVVCLLVLLGMGLSGWAIEIPRMGEESYTMSLGETLNVHTFQVSAGDGYYVDNCYGMLRVDGVPNSEIVIRGCGRTERMYDYVEVYDGTDNNGVFLGRFSGDEISFALVCGSGSAYLIFRSDHHRTYEGVSMTLHCCRRSDNIYNMRDSVVSGSEAWMMWDDSSGTSQWNVIYGRSWDEVNMVVANENRLLLSQLEQGDEYFVEVRSAMDSCDCGSGLMFFRMPCYESDLCYDFTDLESCRVLCTARGMYTGMDADTGVVDYGSGSGISRHTVHRNVMEYDRHTRYQLKTVPPGELASVRLGNWNIGAENENIRYEYVVDTSVYDMLVMRYAGVLENPEHDADEQPRFRFRILNNDNEEVNPECYSVDFVASESLGWNKVAQSEVLWKNWTAVGVDLDPFHGDTIFVELSTYDCLLGGHFGYAYFTLKCGNKVIEASGCGDMVENTFTAPEGFTYRWYEAGNPDTVLGTDRSLSVTEAGTYNCRMTMVGAANDSCGWTMSVVAGLRYPCARFEVMEVSEECDMKMKFMDRSVVALDEEHSVLSDEGCEAVEWFFGDGESSTERNPLHMYESAGRYEVKLVASLSNGMCTDTIVDTVEVGLACSRTRYVEEAICMGSEYEFFDTVLRTEGGYTHIYGMDTTILTLSVGDTFLVRVEDTIVERQLPWLYGGYVYEDSVAMDTLKYASMMGCDSVVLYSLKVYRNVYTVLDSTICEEALPFEWNDVIFVSSSSYDLHSVGVAAHGADSVLRMNLIVINDLYEERFDTVVENQLPYRYLDFVFDTAVVDSTLVMTDDIGCNSVVDYNLHVWWNTLEEMDSVVCEGDFPVVWQGITFDSAGVDSIVFAGVMDHGMDSIIRLEVMVSPTSYVDIYDTVVENDLPYRYGDFVFEEAVEDTILRLVSSAGCDSIINYSLWVHWNVDTTLYMMVCADALPYVWEGVTFEGAGTQEVTLRDRYGADSTLHLVLDVGDVYEVVIKDSACIDEVYWYGGHSYTSSGRYSDTLSSMVGCDSVVTLDLTLYRNKYLLEEYVLCKGESFTWRNGVTYDEPTDTVKLMMTTAEGCDSVVMLRLDTSDYLKARIWQSVEAVTMDNPVVDLIDKSVGNVSRRWVLPTLVTEDAYFTYHYPMGVDSVEAVLMAVDRYGCEDTARTWIYFKGGQIWAPNVFTPNETENNIFRIVTEGVTEIEVMIFDRRGGFIYRYDTLDGGWDGTMNGTMCPQAAYVYKVRYKTEAYPNRILEKVGTVTLLR